MIYWIGSFLIVLLTILILIYVIFFSSDPQSEYNKLICDTTMLTSNPRQKSIVYHVFANPPLAVLGRVYGLYIILHK